MRIDGTITDSGFSNASVLREYMKKSVGKRIIIDVKLWRKSKTNCQLAYIHVLFKEYVMPALFDAGNISTESEELAKDYIKHHCGFYDGYTLFDGFKYSKLKSFADATLQEMIHIIDETIRVCAFLGVEVPELPEKKAFYEWVESEMKKESKKCKDI